MSDTAATAQSALPGARAEGFVTVEEAGRQGMITLRGDLSEPAFIAAVEAASGCAMPQRRGITQGRLEDDAGASLAWMSLDELLLLVPHDRAPALTQELGQALTGQHHLCVDVSDARAMFRLAGGAGVREVAAKLCPVDFAAGAFAPGEIRRTRMAQIPAALWMPEEGTLCVICFRSVAQYAFDLLKTAAKKGGEVGFYA